jgi:hypothetical protein
MQGSISGQLDEALNPPVKEEVFVVNNHTYQHRKRKVKNRVRTALKKLQAKKLRRAR